MPFHFVQGALVAGLGQLLLWIAGIEVLDDLLISHQLIFSKSEEFIGLIEAQFPSVVLPSSLTNRSRGFYLHAAGSAIVKSSLSHSVHMVFI
jgi:hypothetical protein